MRTLFFAPTGSRRRRMRESQIEHAVSPAGRLRIGHRKLPPPGHDRLRAHPTRGGVPEHRPRSVHGDRRLHRVVPECRTWLALPDGGARCGGRFGASRLVRSPRVLRPRETTWPARALDHVGGNGLRSPGNHRRALRGWNLRIRDPTSGDDPTGRDPNHQLPDRSDRACRRHLAGAGDVPDSHPHRACHPRDGDRPTPGRLERSRHHGGQQSDLARGLRARRDRRCGPGDARHPHSGVGVRPVPHDPCCGDPGGPWLPLLGDRGCAHRGPGDGSLVARPAGRVASNDRVRDRHHRSRPQAHGPGEGGGTLNWLQLGITVITLGCILGVVVMALNLQYGHGGMVNLGLVAYFAAGAYAYAIATQPPPSGVDQYVLGLDWPPWAGFILAGAAALLFGLITGPPSLRLRGEYLAITTFAFAEVFRSLLINERRIGNGTLGLAGIERPYQEAITFTEYDYVFAAAAALFAIVTFVVLHRIVASPYGRLMEAIRDDDVAVVTSGKTVRRGWFFG